MENSKRQGEALLGDAGWLLVSGSVVQIRQGVPSCLLSRRMDDEQDLGGFPHTLSNHSGARGRHRDSGAEKGPALVSWALQLTTNLVV